MSNVNQSSTNSGNINSKLSSFFASFSTNNMYQTYSITKQKKNNIDQVNELLTNVFGSQGLTKASNDIASLANGNSKKEPTPSYNTRTPYVKLIINGLQFYPKLSDKELTNLTPVDELILKNIEVEFQELELSMPFGGVGPTITGKIVLWTRDPVELTDFISNYYTLFDKYNSDVNRAENTNDVPWPVVRLSIGWHIAAEPEILLASPDMEFIVIGMNMSDPGKGVGAEITLQLQDIGSAVLNNSSALDVNIMQDYPQNQLKTIIEGLLGQRLFTLDDFLYINNSNQDISSTLTSGAYSSTGDSTTINTKQQSFLNSVMNTGVQTGLATNTAITQDQYRDFLLGLEATLNPETQKEIVDGIKQTLSNDQISKESVTKVISSLKTAGLSDNDILSNASQNRTFFVNEKNPVLRLNRDTIINTVQKLVEQTMCRWYPISNKRVEDEAKTTTTAQDITAIRSQMSSSSFKTASEEDKQKLQGDLDTAIRKISNSCTLIWIPNFPANINTSTSKDYGINHSKDGAFCLFPQIISENDLISSNVPLIYGPGGSSAPWLYAAGQNMLQVGMAEMSGRNTASLAYGEVMDLNIQHDNILEKMRMTLNENALYAVAGDRWKATNTKKATVSSEDKDRISKEKAALLERQKNDIIQSFMSKIKDIKQGIEGQEEKFKMYYFSGPKAFSGTTSSRTVTYGDRLYNENIAEPQKRNHYNSTDIDIFVKNKLSEKITLFLNYPTSLGMTVLGDPYLLRQGIGAFELINYFPDKTGQYLKLNPLSSGIYMPQVITHTISSGNYITSINAIKIPYYVNGTLTSTLTNPVVSDTTDINALTTVANASKVDLEQQLNALPSLGSPSKAVTTPQKSTSASTGFLASTVVTEMGSSFSNSVANIYQQANIMSSDTQRTALTNFLNVMKKQAINKSGSSSRRETDD